MIFLRIICFALISVSFSKAEDSAKVSEECQKIHGTFGIAHDAGKMRLMHSMKLSFGPGLINIWTNRGADITTKIREDDLLIESRETAPSPGKLVILSAHANPQGFIGQANDVIGEYGFSSLQAYLALISQAEADIVDDKYKEVNLKALKCARERIMALIQKARPLLNPRNIAIENIPSEAKATDVH